MKIRYYSQSTTIYFLNKQNSDIKRLRLNQKVKMSDKLRTTEGKKQEKECSIPGYWLKKKHAHNWRLDSIFESAARLHPFRRLSMLRIDDDRPTPTWTGRGTAPGKAATIISIVSGWSRRAIVICGRCTFSSAIEQTTLLRTSRSAALIETIVYSFNFILQTGILTLSRSTAWADFYCKLINFSWTRFYFHVLIKEIELTRRAYYC